MFDVKSERRQDGGAVAAQFQIHLIDGDSGSINCACERVGINALHQNREAYRPTVCKPSENQHLTAASAKRGSRLGLWLSGFLNLARGDPHDMDRVADYMGGALLAFWSSGIVIALPSYDL